MKRHSEEIQSQIRRALDFHGSTLHDVTRDIKEHFALPQKAGGSEYTNHQTNTTAAADLYVTLTPEPKPLG